MPTNDEWGMHNWDKEFAGNQSADDPPEDALPPDHVLETVYSKEHRRENLTPGDMPDYPDENDA